jgi:hypothetical protein
VTPRVLRRSESLSSVTAAAASTRARAKSAGRERPLWTIFTRSNFRSAAKQHHYQVCSEGLVLDMIFLATSQDLETSNAQELRTIDDLLGQHNRTREEESDDQLRNPKIPNTPDTLDCAIGHTHQKYVMNLLLTLLAPKHAQDAISYKRWAL